MKTHTILYKSGAKIVVTKRGGTITEIEWSGEKNKPLHFGVDDIAAVFVGKL